MAVKCIFWNLILIPNSPLRLAQSHMENSGGYKKIGQLCFHFLKPISCCNFSLSFISIFHFLKIKSINKSIMRQKLQIFIMENQIASRTGCSGWGP